MNHKRIHYNEIVKKNDDRCIAYINAYFVIQALNLFVKTIVSENILWSFTSKAIMVLFLFNALRVIAKRFLLRFLCMEIIFFSSFSYTYFIGGYGVTDITSIMFNVLFVFLPIGFCVICINDMERLLRMLYICSWPVETILLILAFMQIFNGNGYNMPLSYAMVLQALILMDHYFSHRKIYDLGMVLLSVTVIILSGARGPLLCFVAYIMFSLLFSKNISKMKKIVITIVGILLFIVLMLNLDFLLSSIIFFLEQNNISSRTLIYLYNGNFSLSGRDTIFLYYLNKALKGPILGYGLAGGWVNTIYPHNIIIESLLSYGVILGILLLFGLLILLIKGLKSKNLYINRLVIIYLAYAIRLFMTNSFIMEPVLFMLIPLCMYNITITLGKREKERMNNYKFV